MPNNLGEISLSQDGVSLHVGNGVAPAASVDIVFVTEPINLQTANQLQPGLRTEYLSMMSPMD